MIEKGGPGERPADRYAPRIAIEAGDGPAAEHLEPRITAPALDLRDHSRQPGDLTPVRLRAVIEQPHRVRPAEHQTRSRQEQRRHQPHALALVALRERCG